MDMSYCKRECMWMGQGRWDMEPPEGGLFGMDSLMNLWRSTRIVVVSSHRGIFSKWALVGRGHGDSDRSLFFWSLYLYVSSRLPKI